MKSRNNDNKITIRIHVGTFFKFNTSYSSGVFGSRQATSSYVTYEVISVHVRRLVKYIFVGGEQKMFNMRFLKINVLVDTIGTPEDVVQCRVIHNCYISHHII